MLVVGVAVPCGLASRYQLFGGTFCFQHQGWRWKQYVSLKRLCLHRSPHGDCPDNCGVKQLSETTQKPVNFILAAIRIRNHHFHWIFCAACLLLCVQMDRVCDSICQPPSCMFPWNTDILPSPCLISVLCQVRALSRYCIDFLEHWYLAKFVPYLGTALISWNTDILPSSCRISVLHWFLGTLVSCQVHALSRYCIYFLEHWYLAKFVPYLGNALISWNTGILPSSCLISVLHWFPEFVLPARSIFDKQETYYSVLHCLFTVWLAGWTVWTPI
jgi:hypothetical protein